MADVFNSYHQWLGLGFDFDPQGSPPNLYQLLDLPLFETDHEKIAAAADKALSRVRSQRPGEHARQWAEILDQLAEAKKKLLDPELKRQYDQQIQHDQEQEPPQPSHRQTPRQQTKPQTEPQSDPNFTPFSPFAGVAAPPVAEPEPPEPSTTEPPKDSLSSFMPPHLQGGPPVDPMAPMDDISVATPPPSVSPPAISPPSSTPSAAGAEDAASRFVAHRTAQSRQGVIVLLMGLLAFGAICGVFIFVVQSPWFQGDKNQSQSPQEPPVTAVAGHESSPSATNREPNAAAPSSDPPVDLTPQPLPAETSDPQPTPAVDEPSVAMTEPDKREETAVGSNPPVSDPPPSAPPTPEELVALSTALKAARRALADHDVETALQELAKVKNISKQKSHAEAYDRLNEFVKRSGQFWAAVEAALKQVQPGDQLQYRSATVVVKRVAPLFVVYEAAGEQRRAPVRKLPLGLAIALAEKELGQTGSAKAAFGAPLAAQSDEALIAAGRAYWEQAAQEGENTDVLLAALEDQYNFAPQTEDLYRALRSARKALAENQLSEADKQLTRAESLAKSPQQREKAARLRMLADYVTEFWEAVNESLMDLEAGDIEVNGEPVSIVEVTPEKLVIKRRGQVSRYTRQETPAGLARALAERWLRRDEPSTRVILGAIHAVQLDKEQHAKARKLWQDAVRAGADIGDLIQVLDDEYELNAAGKGVIR